MKIKSVNELAATLHADAVLSLHDRQLTVRSPLGAPLVILWPIAPGAGAVQVMQLSAVVVPRERHTAMTLLLADLNVALPLPGFSLDTTTGRVVFRAPVLLDVEGAIDLAMLQNIVRVCHDAVASHLAVLQGFASGESALPSAGA